MKFRLTLSFLLLLTCFKLSAQTEAIQFGIRAGLSSTSLSRKPGTDIQVHDADKSGAGYFAGAFASFNIDRFSLQPAIIFNSLSSKTTEEVLSGDIVYNMYGKWRLYYIQVPVNLIYNIPVQGGHLYVGAGPYIGTALLGKFTPASGNESPGQSSPVDFSFKARFGDDNRNNFKSFDYGGNAVAGFEFDNGLMINAVYNLGLANIQSDNYLYNSTKIRSLSIAFGYKF
jgi:hypothetical protein